MSKYIVVRDNVKNNYRIQFVDDWVSYLDFSTYTRITRTWKTEAAARSWIEKTVAARRNVENRFTTLDLPYDETE